MIRVVGLVDVVGLVRVVRLVGVVGLVRVGMVVRVVRYSSGEICRCGKDSNDGKESEWL